MASGLLQLAVSLWRVGLLHAGPEHHEVVPLGAPVSVALKPAQKGLSLQLVLGAASLRKQQRLAETLV